MSATLVMVIPGLICGWWFIRNLRLYGDPLATAATNASMKALSGSELLQSRQGLTAESLLFGSRVLFNSLWYSGGWNQLSPLLPPSLLLWLAAASSVVARFLCARARPYDATLVIGQGVGKVAFHEVSSRLKGRSGFLA